MYNRNNPQVPYLKYNVDFWIQYSTNLWLAFSNN